MMAVIFEAVDYSTSSKKSTIQFHKISKIHSIFQKIQFFVIVAISVVLSVNFKNVVKIKVEMPNVNKLSRKISSNAETQFFHVIVSQRLSPK